MAAVFTTSTDSSLTNTYSGPAAQNVTMMAWVYITATSPNTYRYVVSQQSAGLALMVGTGTAGVSANYGSNAIDNEGRTVPVNQWTHLAMTVRFSSASRAFYTGYFNGAVDVRFDDSLRTYSTYSSWCIGNKGVGGANPFNGYIQDVRVWRRVLTGKEIQQEMGSPSPVNSTNLIFWVPLTTSNWFDASGAGEHFTQGAQAVALTHGNIPRKPSPRLSRRRTL